MRGAVNAGDTSSSSSEGSSSSGIEVPASKNRALVFLVETANMKTPSEDSLGDSSKVS